MGWEDISVHFPNGQWNWLYPFSICPAFLLFPLRNDCSNVCSFLIRFDNLLCLFVCCCFLLLSFCTFLYVLCISPCQINGLKIFSLLLLFWPFTVLNIWFSVLKLLILMYLVNLVFVARTLAIDPKLVSYVGEVFYLQFMLIFSCFLLSITILCNEFSIM